MPDLSDRAASLPDLQNLRRAAGLSVFPDPAVTISLQRTPFGVWMRDDHGRLVGMGRVTGDGGCFVQINDIAVYPAFQRQRHGGAVLRRLLAWCEEALPQGCYISLFADPGAERLYERHRFTLRTGMARRVP